ncbi:MAG: acyl-ACP--UDP-N-acetylglucosamine O-acyltransferase [Planctomycetes bacterium]|nr:acyl-ACP--UDP-N-acetylglucosamine O-acyltransferase [Planctomycetota bacterium]
MTPTHVHPTAIIGQEVVIGHGTRIGAYAVIEERVVLGRDNVVYPHAFVGRGTTLGDRNHVHPGAVIGHLPQDVRFDPAAETFTVIGDDNVFREHCQVHRATKPGGATTIGSKNLFMALSHVAHDCKVGDGVVLVNQASLPGHCEVGDRVIMSGFTGIHQFCRIGRLAMVSALSVSNKDLPPFFIYGGRPALAESVNVVGLRRAGVSKETRDELRRAYKLLYREGLTVPEALLRIEAGCKSPEAAELVAFIRASKRGVAPGTMDVGDTLSTKKSRAVPGRTDEGEDDEA